MICEPVLCPLQVAHIDLSRQSPCAAGQVICFSLYGGPEVDVRSNPTVGERQSMIWVDTLLDDEVWRTAAQLVQSVKHTSVRCHQCTTIDRPLMRLCRMSRKLCFMLSRHSSKMTTSRKCGTTTALTATSWQTM